MGLRIETFSNLTGGMSFFKALGHPLAAPKARALVERLAAAGPVAVYDPVGHAGSFAELYDLSGLDIAGVYVQDIAEMGRTVLGRTTEPVTELPGSGAATVFVVAYDAGRLIDHIRHLLPQGADTISLDAMRIPDDMLTRPGTYLDPLNFATNYAFFREGGGHHTRVVTANYWAGYGATGVALWCCLFGADGAVLAQWRKPLADGVTGVVIDSAEVRETHGLGEFTGQLFMHVVGIAGHDVVKYALDTYGDAPEVLSCTHDANAWPADRYAGLPAPAADEDVVLWVQNSHPCPIERGEIGLNLMGDDRVAWLDERIPAYGSYPLDTRELLPAAHWPQQIEIRAGKYFVRPRYEVRRHDGRLRIAHPNVEREDLEPDPRIPEISNLMGKAYLLPAPILPVDRFASSVLPTPMATGQTRLPVAVLLHDASGRLVHHHFIGNLDRADSVAVEMGELIGGNGALPSGYGHMELVYDFSAGGEADGWLHGLFRYEDRTSGHAAETSFGTHIFNTVLTYGNEPQSYAGRPPGLSTRLFLRLGEDGTDTLCHLIYPASTPWHATSDTRLQLHAADGTGIACREVAIPCSGSLLWRASEMFDGAELRRAADGGYVIVRDTTCRLFGYHGLIRDGVAFSFDHMFGF